MLEAYLRPIQVIEILWPRNELDIRESRGSESQQALMDKQWELEAKNLAYSMSEVKTENQQLAERQYELEEENHNPFEVHCILSFSRPKAELCVYITAFLFFMTHKHYICSTCLRGSLPSFRGHRPFPQVLITCRASNSSCPSLHQIQDSLFFIKFRLG